MTDTDRQRPLTPQDRWDISDLLSTYCLAADTRDFTLLDQVFTDDVDVVFQTGAASGLSELKAFMGAILATLTATQHNVTTSVVRAAKSEAGPQSGPQSDAESGSPDEAEATTYLLVQHLRAGTEGGETLAMGGTYHDRLRRTPDGWRIYRRSLIGSWRTGNPAVIVRPS